MAREPEFSVVVTCYYEERSIDEFYARLRATLEKLGRPFELVMVNDGSTDGTFERLKAIHARDPHVTVLDLFRNSGQGNAMTAAIERARGRHFVFMDSDLQLDPEELPLLVAAFDEGNDVVSGARRERRDALSRRLFSALANVIMRRMTRAPFTDFGCTFKIYRGELIRAYEPGPRRPFTLYIMRGASRFKEVAVNHHPRKYGKSGWTLRKLWRFNLENFLGASEGTFQRVSFIAFAIAALTFLRIALAWLIPASILGQPVTTGLILNALLLATAALLGVLALVGEYVVRLHNRAFGGPRYIVREARLAWSPDQAPGQKSPQT